MILHCMLTQGTKKERLWSYTRLNWHWDDAFIRPIECCYTEYHEVESASLIVKNFPLDYVYQHHDELAAVAGWGYVIRRLGKVYPEPTFPTVRQAVRMVYARRYPRRQTGRNVLLLAR